MSFGTPVKIGGGSSTSTASLTQTNSAAIAATDLLVVSIHTKGTITAVSDSANGSYTLLGPAATSGSAKQYFAYKTGAAASSSTTNTLTITLSAAAELTTVWSNVSTGGSGCTFKHSVNSTATSSVTTLSVVLTIDTTGDLALYGVGNTQAQAFTNLSGTTSQLAATSISGSGLCTLCYLTSATAGSLTCSVQTGGNSDNDSGIAVSFSLGTGGGTVSSGVVDMGTGSPGGGVSAVGTSIIASGMVNIGNQNQSDAAFPDLPLGSNKGGLAVPDLPMGGKGAMSLPDLPLGNVGGGVVPTGNTLKPVSLFTIGDNGAGLIGTALLIVPSGIIDMGDNGAGIIATGYTQTVLGDLGAGLLATGTAIIPSGQITMGGQGDLVATGIIPIQSGVVLLGTNGDGIVPSGTAVSYSGVVNTGSQGAGLVETVLVLVSPTQFSVGNNGGGITPFFAPLTIRSGQVLMGGGGGIQVTASMTISVGVVMGNSPHSGLPPISGSIGFPGGHWQYFTLWMWRASQGPGWKLVRLHRWKNGAWKNI